MHGLESPELVRLRAGGLVRVRQHSTQRYCRAVPEALGELRFYREAFLKDRLFQLKDETERAGIPFLYRRGVAGTVAPCRAELYPQPGGAFTFNVTGTHTTRGMFRELEPGRRLVFTSLFDHVQPPLPTTVEVTLTPLGRGTRVRLRHHGFADQALRDRHASSEEVAMLHGVHLLRCAARRSDRPRTGRVAPATVLTPRS